MDPKQDEYNKTPRYIVVKQQNSKGKEKQPERKACHLHRDYS